MLVIPAKAGTQRLEDRQRHWVPAFAGMTDWGVLNFREVSTSWPSYCAAFSGDHVFPGQQWACAGMTFALMWAND
jgi:hypothetical protein